MAFAEAFGIVTAHYMDLNLKHLCIFCMGACLVFALLKAVGFSREEFKSLKICALAFALGLALMSSAAHKESSFFESLNGATLPDSADTVQEEQIVEVVGVPMSVTAKKGYYSLVIKTDSEKVLVKLMGMEGDPEAVYAMAGRRCSFKGEVSVPSGRRNFGCFDYRLYLKSRGIYTCLTVSKFRARAGKLERPLLNLLSLRKGQFYQGAKEYIDEESLGLLAALLFGDKGYMDSSVYEEFQANGIAHVLAVSGLHVSLVYEILLKLLENRRNLRTSFLIVLSMFCYICLANFSVSVLRAALMIILRLAAFHLKRRYDLVSAASFAAIIFMNTNPYSIFDSGFQLSYMAAFSMGIILPWLELKTIKLADELKKGWVKGLGDVLNPCFAVQIGMTPLIIFHFLVISPVSLLLNPFAVFIAGLIMPAGLMFFLLQGLGIGAISAAAAGPAAAFADLLLKLNELGTFLKGSSPFPAPPIGILIFYYGFVFFFFSEARHILRRKGRPGPLWTVSLSLALACALIPKAYGLTEGCLPWEYESYSINFVDVGQGDCVHIRMEDKNILIDGGGSRTGNIAKNTLQPYLLKNGVSGLELALVTHPDSDHALGIAQLSQLMPIKTIAFSCSYEDSPGITEGYRAENFLFLGRGDLIELGGNSELKVLWPLKGVIPEADDNDNSLVIEGKIGSIKALFTGDITAETEAKLLKLQDFEDVDLLKLAHHGSAYSSSPEFVTAVAPAAAVASCRHNNSYGHPALRVRELLFKEGIELLRTDNYGAVAIKETEGGFIAVNADKTIFLSFTKASLLLKEAAIQ